jgi:hypothetical protein
MDEIPWKTKFRIKYHSKLIHFQSFLNLLSHRGIYDKYLIMLQVGVEKTFRFSSLVFITFPFYLLVYIFQHNTRQISNKNKSWIERN